MKKLRKREDIFPKQSKHKSNKKRVRHLSIDHGDTEKIDHSVVLPEIWDAELFVNKICNYITRFDKVDKTEKKKAIQEVIQRTGLNH